MPGVRAGDMNDASTVIQTWVSTLGDGATWERVRSDFWYVRIPGHARRWIPIEIEVGERSVKLTSHVIIEPDEAQASVYELLLRHNHESRGAAFSLDGREGVICLVARVLLEHFDEGQLDHVAGSIIETTEATFRTILNLGFASRLRR